MSKSPDDRILPMSVFGPSTDGNPLCIRFSFFTSRFGECIVASTTEGVCHLAFCGDRPGGLSALQTRFPRAVFSEESAPAHREACECMSDPLSFTKTVRLHLMGTDFQIRVWEELLKIAFGETTSYGRLARALGDPKASRAVGAAVGRNPVAFIVPCHRVVHSDGAVGGYMWGRERKREILAWEAGRFGLFS